MKTTITIPGEPTEQGPQKRVDNIIYSTNGIKRLKAQREIREQFSGQSRLRGHISIEFIFYTPDSARHNDISQAGYESFYKQVLHETILGNTNYGFKSCMKFSKTPRTEIIITM